MKSLITSLFLASTLYVGAQTPISSLPVATTANSSDVTVLVQAGQTKQISTANLVSSITPTINGSTTNIIQALILAGANITLTTNASGQLTLLVSGLGTAAFSNSVSFMASTNATGIRTVHVNEAGMAGVTPLNSTEYVFNDDQILHRATGSLIGNWNDSTSIFGLPGRVNVGGNTGASSWNIFSTHDIVDYSTIVADGTNSFDGYGWADNFIYVVPHQEATLAIDGHTNHNSYFQGNNYLQFNPRFGTHNSNSVTNTASFGVSFISFENGGDTQSVWNWEFYNATNGDHILYAGKALNVNGLTMHDGKEALHIDGTNGILGLRSSSMQGVAGQGQVSWTSVGVISGSNTLFKSTLAVGDQLYIGGNGITIIGITSETNAVGLEQPGAQGYSVYTIQRSSAVLGNINQINTTTRVTAITSNGELVTGGSDPANGSGTIGLFTGDSRWQMTAATTQFFIKGPVLNTLPFAIQTNAPNNAFNIDGTTNVIIGSALRVGGTATSPVWTTGTGSPEGKIIGPIGSIYSRTDGGASTSFYVKESGTGNTGWVGK